ncbi:MAG: LamG domain-containing protein [Planctomycetes bacterium]|nr:LamG domain-containing protein [Planctomycetota bacterium]
MIRFKKTKSLDPTGKPLAVEAWVNASKPAGVILARGGPSVGYALVLQAGKPKFMVRTTPEKLAVAGAKQSIVGKWVHLVGVLTADKKLELYVDGQLAASGNAPGFLPSDPAQSLEIGADDQGAVGKYTAPLGFSGMIDEVRVYHGTLTAEEIAELAKGAADLKSAKAVLSCSFDNRDAKDLSGNENHGSVAGAQPVRGKSSIAMQFVGRASRAAGSFVKHKWTKDIPIVVQAMVKANDTLFIVGPPDVVDEEKTFQQLTARDPRVAAMLARQEALLQGKEGSLIWAVSATDGKKLAELKLDSLPVWDGLAAAQGKLFLSTADGKVVCLGKR